MSPSQAALNTPTGKAAQKAGFTNTSINTSPDGVVSFDFTK
ncbi:hypothetical protein IWQ47_005196 [Aquimarina sp. EL_43]|nr:MULTISPECIES: hypothetical protein [unclassified Aquimarina]MBG6133724.1 hypothetical protein [Aquimarina sp. EL_35]MBG6153897.1 hypothetical protein [Aquimarina sp. EL_32]MBG6172097.1 hypothetical protein [Aquimarina sp. EL_43]